MYNSNILSYVNVRELKERWAYILKNDTVVPKQKSGHFRVPVYVRKKSGTMA
jgi:hypothetical protein